MEELSICVLKQLEIVTGGISENLGLKFSVYEGYDIKIC